MKSVKGLSDIQDFFNWMWAVDPRLASRLNDLHDYYRRACKQAARSAATYGDFPSPLTTVTAWMSETRTTAWSWACSTSTGATAALSAGHRQKWCSFWK